MGWPFDAVELKKKKVNERNVRQWEGENIAIF
jgi:hypothetical protein